MWRRETDNINSGKHYIRPENPTVNQVVIEEISNFTGISKVLYTIIGANIERPTPQKLAELAIRSTQAEYGKTGKDGISYLISVKRQGIRTPLMEAYEDAILNEAGARSLEEALTICLDENSDNAGRLKNVIQEFLAVVNSIVGVFFDAKAGFNLNVKQITDFEKKSLKMLNSNEHDQTTFEDLDSAWIIYGKGDPNINTAQSFHDTTQREFKIRNSEFGGNSKFVGNMCLIAIYQFWDDKYRNQIAKIFEVKKSQVKSDIFGDLRLIRHSIIHHNGVAKGDVNKCKLLNWFKPNEEILIDQEKLLQIVSHINRLKLEIKRA